MKRKNVLLRLMLTVAVFFMVITNCDNKAYATSMDMSDGYETESNEEDADVDDGLNVVSENALNNDVVTEDEDVVDTCDEAITLSEASRNALRGYWDGVYRASQGITSLRLKIVSVSADGRVQAFFHFTEHPDNPGVPYGCYTMEGTYNAATGKLDLEGVKWLFKPSTYSFVDIHSDVNEAGKTMEGYVGANQYSIYDGLSLKKSYDLTMDTDIDSSIAKYYEEYGKEGFGSIEDTIKIGKVGKKYKVTPVADSKWNVVTVCKGNKFTINSIADKKTFITSNRAIASVSSKGEVTAKKGGRARISYTINGVPQVVQVIVVEPTLISKDQSASIKNMTATALKDTKVNVSIHIPLNAEIVKITNKNIITDLNVAMDNEGHFTLSGNAVKKGKVVVKYVVNGKKGSFTVKVKK